MLLRLATDQDKWSLLTVTSSPKSSQSHADLDAFQSLSLPDPDVSGPFWALAPQKGYL